MSVEIKLDGRRLADFEREFRRRTNAVLTQNGRRPDGKSIDALFSVAARIEEEVARRIDQAPAKQTDNFYAAVGIGRDPARPATVPMAFKLTETTRESLSAPAGTQLMVDAGEPVIFETTTRIDLAPGTIAAMRGVDVQSDAVFLPAPSILSTELPLVQPITRRLRSAAALGSSKLQVNPVTGLGVGMVIECGEGPAARHYSITAIEGELLTVIPPLERALADNALVSDVAHFAPFAPATRNHQFHALYLGHASLLNLPSAVSIGVTGANLPADTVWSWWGKAGEGGTPAWHDMDAVVTSAITLTKPPGKSAKTKVGNHETFWLRARLPGRASAASDLQDVRLTVGGVNSSDQSANAAFEAIANTTPIATNRPFFPFGQEPRLFDSFNIGSNEAFSKAGAQVEIDFEFGGAALGPLAAVSDDNGNVEVYGVGSEGQLYRAHFGTEPPSLKPVTRLDGGALVPRAPVAIYKNNDGQLFVAVGGRDCLEVVELAFGGLLDAASVQWETYTIEPRLQTGGVAAAVVALTKGKLDGFLALFGSNLVGWEIGSEATAKLRSTKTSALLKLEGTGQAITAELPIAASLTRTLFAHDSPFGPGTQIAELADVSKFKNPLAAWKGKAPDIWIAGCNSDDELVIFKIEGDQLTDKSPSSTKVGLPPRFHSPTGSSDAPTLSLATTVPTWIIDDGNGCKVVRDSSTINQGNNLFRHMLIEDGLTVVHRHDVGLYYRFSDFPTPDLDPDNAPPWNSLGQNAPASPVLSWEYWNGDSWWGLDPDAPGKLGVSDTTANFQKGGRVSFKVPADIQPIEVIGRKNHWVRARLAGGDYGEAKTTVATETLKDVTKQSASRDTSTISAPYIVSMRVGYSALNPVKPELVLTEDCLGMVDQTSANDAGLMFQAFIPVGAVMNPVDRSQEAADKSSADGICSDPCPADRPPAPDPCDAAGAYESCDSPCLAPPGHLPTRSNAATGFARGLLIGFSKAFNGNNISLYVDALPTKWTGDLRADMLVDGRFVPVEIADDASYGLTEPGLLSFALPQAAKDSVLLGESAHWLRLYPSAEFASGWSPVLRAVHLNAVQCQSVETRRMERLGTSNALPRQVFRLSASPIEPKSLILRLRESLAEEDKKGLDIAVYKDGIPGDWVRWHQVADFASASRKDRCFLINPDQGTIHFGDGQSGRIPPLGNDVLAEQYARVVGNASNNVVAGVHPSLLTSIAGVQTVTTLDHAAGGVDTEAPAQARRRASVKVGNGGRILTRSDLREYACTLAPDIAQVYADTRAGGMRLVVALAGNEPRPLPARLRQFAASIREVAGYGIARPGGLMLAAPRLLPISVALALQPHQADMLAEAEVQARACLLEFFDAATGNHDHRGWPMGRIPNVQDIAAALDQLSTLAVIATVPVLRRVDTPVAAQSKLPASVPSDVLIRLSVADIHIERVREAAL
jgi:Baseplate J-like protein